MYYFRIVYQCYIILCDICQNIVWTYITEEIYGKHNNTLYSSACGICRECRTAYFWHHHNFIALYYYVIIIFQPAVSVGNVGQLAVDMVISTLWMERIGYIYHDSILPLVGNDPFAHPESVSCKIVTSCEGTFVLSNYCIYCTIWTISPGFSLHFIIIIPPLVRPRYFLSHFSQ